MPWLQRNTAMLKTVIVGSKRKAEIFAHLLEGATGFEMTGFYDPDDELNADATGGLLYALELAGTADVFMIDRHVKALPALMIEQMVRLQKHILFDGFPPPDICASSQITRLHQESGNCMHIANVLHNKPLYTTASQYIRKPRFIRLEKHCRQPGAGEFESWLYRELGQDLDLIMRTAQSGIRNVSARPLFLFGNNPDLLNIHIEFDNDAVCHITAGRAIEPRTHKMRVFQQDRFFLLDFSENNLQEFRPLENKDQLTILPAGEQDHSHEFSQINRPVMPFDAWKMELRNFRENIDKGLTPITSLENLCNVNDLSSLITEKVQRRYHEV